LRNKKYLTCILEVNFCSWSKMFVFFIESQCYSWSIVKEKKNRKYRYKNPKIQVQKSQNTGTKISKYRYKNLKIQVQKSQNTGIKISKYRYKNLKIQVQKSQNTGIKISKYRYKNLKIQVQKSQNTGIKITKKTRILFSYRITK
jgi:hypothetical protein